MSDKVIRNGRIVTAVDDYRGDILIKTGRIAAIGESLDVDDNVEVHDANGLMVIPGGIDPHTHMENVIDGAKTCDTFESGTRAAAFGGTTTIVDFAFQHPSQSLPEAIARVGENGEANAGVDFGLHAIATRVDDSALADMREAIRHEGVTSFKLFMAYPGVLMLDDAAIFRALRTVGSDGGLVALHAENGPVIDQLVHEALEAGHTSPRYHALTRPAIMEAEAMHRGIRLAELAEAPVYFVHLSSKEGLSEVVRARDAGIPVFAETCPHYLFLDESVYDDESFDVARYVMSPPVRDKDSQAALWRGLKFDDLQLIATDHCPFCMKEGHLGNINQKPRGAADFSRIPNGVPGVETRMSLVFDGGVRPGRISMNRFVQLTSTAAAKLFGLFPRKGTIAVGSDADIVVFDPEARHTISAQTHHSNCDFTMFEGREVQGKVRKVFLRGEVIVDGDDWHGRAGGGQFVRRSETRPF